MPRKNTSAEKRQQILTAFGKCLCKTEFSSISVRDIAAEAGMPLGSIHYYFKNKTEIMLKYYEQTLEEYVELIRAWADGISPEISTFAQFYNAYTEFTKEYFFYEEEKRLTKNYMHFYALMAVTPELQAQFQALNHRNADEIVRAMEKTRFRCKKPQVMARILMGLWDGFSLFCEISIDDVTRADLFLYLNDLIGGEAE